MEYLQLSVQGNTSSIQSEWYFNALRVSLPMRYVELIEVPTDDPIINPLCKLTDRNGIPTGRHGEVARIIFNRTNTNIRIIRFRTY
eukprot:UN06818